MAHIVCLNYRDPESKNKWLKQDTAQHPDEAVECGHITAFDVEFRPSSKHEFGFGYTMVALCGSVQEIEESDLKSTDQFLCFHTNRFYDVNTHDVISFSKKVDFRSDGSMRYES